MSENEHRLKGILKSSEMVRERDSEPRKKSFILNKVMTKENISNLKKFYDTEFYCVNCGQLFGYDYQSGREKNSRPNRLCPRCDRLRHRVFSFSKTPESDSIPKNSHNNNI